MINRAQTSCSAANQWYPGASPAEEIAANPGLQWDKKTPDQKAGSSLSMTTVKFQAPGTFQDIDAFLLLQFHSLQKHASFIYF